MIQKIIPLSLEKTSEAGLIKEEGMEYIPNKVLLKNLIRLKSTLILRYFFYFMFFTLGLFLELTLFRPSIISKEYLIALMFTASTVFVFGLETYSNWRGF